MVEVKWLHANTENLNHNVENVVAVLFANMDGEEQRAESVEVLKFANTEKKNHIV